jgi:hypothetical protein
MEAAFLFRGLSQRPRLGRFNEVEHEIHRKWRIALENFLGEFNGVLLGSDEGKEGNEKYSG